jgi:hypothetical protein
VTQAASTAPPDGAAKAQALETSACALAERHRPLARTPSARTRFAEETQVTRALEYAQRHLAVKPAKDAALPRAAEWFLDNYYLIRRVARQIKEDLPPGFARRLPWVATGDFRVELLASELVAMMRLDPGVGVEYSIRALRLLDVIDWKAFFAQTNRVEAILNTDPAGVYPRMDFQTRDSYRRVVEALAWRTGRGEHDVADLAIAQASAPDGDDRHRHVGYHLVGSGRAVLEQRLGYRPTRSLLRSRSPSSRCRR